MASDEKKCIAVIISKPERKYQQGLLEGVCKSAYARGLHVAVFATSLLDGTEKYIWGEKEIFELINYDKVAGVIYAVGSFYGNAYTEVLNQKMLEVLAKGIPVIAVDGRVPGLPMFFNDDGNSLEDVIDHFVVDHGVRDVACMTGFHGNPHAENALANYKRTMAKHGIELTEDRMYYGDYWYNEAENFIHQLMESERGLPGAIVCVNEHMAIALYRAFHEREIYVPSDILIGCTANDADSAPYLLVGENNCANVGYEACEKIFRMLDGEGFEEEPIFVPSKSILKTSIGCGCQKISAYDYSKERGIIIDNDPGFFGEFNFDRGEMLATKDFPELFKIFNEYTRYLKDLHNIYFCMCDGWDSPHFLIKDTKENPYTDLMQFYFSREEGENGPEIYIGENRYFRKEDMFPKLFEDGKEPSIFIFRGIHFAGRNFGYAVLDNGPTYNTYEVLYNHWLHDISYGLEAQCRMQSMNYMFYTDIMTGLYNRNGFNTMLPDIIKDAVEKKQQIMLVMADLNFLKTINDTYGHKEGDFAITMAAELLRSKHVQSAMYEKNFRIGGDEYVKVAVGEFTEEDAKEYQGILYDTVEAFSISMDKPYQLQMSAGVCIEEIHSMEELEAVLAKADKKMYAEKLRLKATRS